MPPEQLKAELRRALLATYSDMDRDFSAADGIDYKSMGESVVSWLDGL